MKFPEVPGKTPYDQFVNLVRHVIAVPKADVEEKKRRQKRRRKAAATTAVALLLLSSCVRSSYTPMRPPVLPMPATDSGKACWRECAQTTQICENGCRTSYQASILTAAAVEAKVKTIVQQCKDRCADRRDECLATCS